MKKTEKVHINYIMPGASIIVKGVERTVTKKDINYGFMGKTIFGDSYRLGRTLVERVVHIPMRGTK